MTTAPDALLLGFARALRASGMPVTPDREAGYLEAVAAVDKGDGVVVLTDMFGGTPSNLAISVMDDAQVEVIAGINLPMLVKLASVRAECSLKQAIDKAKEAGRKYISVASQVLAGHH